jgi:DNA-binding transcriptional regulator YiaG
MAKRRAQWDADKVRALRQHMGLTQDAMAQALGTRQQTISEWETGLYQPRGLSERLLGMVAENAGFEYDAGEREQGSGGEADGQDEEAL